MCRLYVAARRGVHGLLVVGGCAAPIAPSPPAASVADASPARAEVGAAPIRVSAVPRPLAAPEAPAAARLASAHLEAGRRGMARVALDRLLSATPEHALAPAARLVSADLLARGGQHRAAATRFGAVAVEWPELADYAHFRAARAAQRSESWPLVIEHAGAVGAGSRYAPWAARLEARALLATGRATAAATLLQRSLSDAPPAEDADAWLQLAEARLTAGDVAGGVKALHAITVRHPGHREAASRLKRQRWRTPPEIWRAATAANPRDALLRGRYLLETHDAARLEAEMLTLLRDTSGLERRAWCDTWWLLARARTRQRAHEGAGPAYRRFALDCAHDHRAADARYAEGLAWFTVDHPDLAIDALEALSREHPADRLADDALVALARVHRSVGDSDAARDRLLALLWTHPQGDMTGEALFQLLDDDPATVAEVDPEPYERTLLDRGRLHYFLGVRALAADEPGRAAARFEATVHQGPAGYYALLALNRLREMDPQGFADRLEGLRPKPRRGLPAASLAHPIREEAMTLLGLGLGRAAWSAFDHAGPGPLPAARYRAGIADLFAAAGQEATAARILERDVAWLDDAWPLDEDHARFVRVYPQAFAEEIVAEAEARGLDPALLFGLTAVESRFDPRARSWAGACGLTQLLPSTARDLARAEGIRGRLTCRRLFDPRLAVRLGARLLADLRDRHGDHPGLIAAGYNGGHGNLDRWLAGQSGAFDAWVEALPFRQTRVYVKRVLQAAWMYRWLRAPAAAPLADRVLALPAAVIPSAP